MIPGPPLPIDEVLPDLVAAVRATGLAVLEAPPGAGKTTKVPLALLDTVKGRIVMLEPRRVAARASAERMAEMLGERVGQTVGYRIRGEAKLSRATRIEVVTEGILTRWLQADPELPGIGAVIFDEFHERALTADLGLALALEAQSALRPDLVLIAMSATLDAAPVAALMGGASVITSAGRAFPVQTKWLERPRRGGADFARDVAGLVERALVESGGGALVFLPGAGEIRRVAGLLSGRVGAEIQPLYGAMSLSAQRAAIRPLETGRKLVLATAIAETSLTIEDIRIVVDAGRARRARFDPGSGMTRLVTERVSRAEADQRRGRAGRVAPGICYRMWTRGEEGALVVDPPPEIASADLAALALELAVWGSDPSNLAFLTPPPEAAYGEAIALCQALGALDEEGRITTHGRVLAKMPLHPRLAHMLSRTGPAGAEVAALVSAAPLRVEGASLDARLGLLASPPAHLKAPVRAIRDEVTRLRRSAPEGDGATYDPGEMLALAYPDRIGLRRSGDAPRWVLAGGKGAWIDAGDALAGARLLVAADLDGNAREAQIRLASEISESEVRALFPDRISDVQTCGWDKRRRTVRARRQERLGALVLSDQVWKDVPPQDVARAALDGVRDLGLPRSKAGDLLVARIRAVGIGGFSDEDLMDSLEGWLLPFFRGVRTAADIARFDPLTALQARLGWEGKQELDRRAPAHFVTPMGHRVAIDYASDPPGIALRLQELFGQSEHPTIRDGQVPLKLTLLSPARRPIAVTSDLPGFWDGAYADVRKDMRGQYPKHPWPENPRAADPTLRAKPRRR